MSGIQLNRLVSTYPLPAPHPPLFGLKIYSSLLSRIEGFSYRIEYDLIWNSLRQSLSLIFYFAHCQGLLCFLHENRANPLPRGFTGGARGREILQRVDSTF